MSYERGFSRVVASVGLAAMVVQGFMPPALPRPCLHQAQRRAGAARLGGSTAAKGVTGNTTSRTSSTAARVAESSSPLLLDLADAAAADRTPNRAPLVEAAGLLEGQEVDKEKEGEGEEEEEEGGWVEDSAELLSKGAEAIGAGVKSVALASKPVKREACGRLVPDGQGLLNLCILVFSGLWAIHSIVTVDASSWRGWTVQETLMRLPWANWDSYEMGLVEHPIITKTAINAVIYLIGDWMSQVNWGREEDIALWEFDLQRTLRNGLIGALFGPVVHYYYNFSDWFLPPDVAINRPFKIMMDQSIFFCSKVFVYISLVCLLRGDSLKETKETLQEKYTGVVTTGWRFWPFVHIFTYFLIPPRHRVLWVNSVDLLWNSILCGMTSGSPAQGGPVTPSEDEGGVVFDAVDGAVAGTAVASSSSAAAANGASPAAAAAAAAATTADTAATDTKKPQAQEA